MSNKTPADIIALIQDRDIRMVDVRFVDLLGSWQHFTVPAHELDDAAFAEGFGFDGSSVRGWKTINASDMLVMPDASSAIMDPFMEAPTLALMGSVVDTITRQDYERCPRALAGRAEAYLKSTGIADTAYIGPEAEFFIFDDVRFDTREGHQSFYKVDASSGWWNTGACG